MCESEHCVHCLYCVKEVTTATFTSVAVGRHNNNNTNRMLMIVCEFSDVAVQKSQPAAPLPQDPNTEKDIKGNQRLEIIISTVTQLSSNDCVSFTVL